MDPPRLEFVTGHSAVLRRGFHSGMSGQERNLGSVLKMEIWASGSFGWTSGALRIGAFIEFFVTRQDVPRFYSGRRAFRSAGPSSIRTVSLKVKAFTSATRSNCESSRRERYSVLRTLCLIMTGMS